MQKTKPIYYGVKFTIALHFKIETAKTFQTDRRSFKIQLDSWRVCVQVSLSSGEFGDGTLSSKTFFSHPKLYI